MSSNVFQPSFLEFKWHPMTWRALSIILYSEARRVRAAAARAGSPPPAGSGPPAGKGGKVPKGSKGGK